MRILVLLIAFLFCFQIHAAGYPVNCVGGTNALNYSTSANVYSCNSISAGATPTSPSLSLQYNNGAGGFGGATGLYYSTTRSGIDFLASTTSANLISLGDKGLDTTSIAVGPSALVAQTITGANNIVVGSNSMASITTGHDNIAIGNNNHFLANTIDNIYLASSTTMDATDTNQIVIGRNITTFNGANSTIIAPGGGTFNIGGANDGGVIIGFGISCCNAGGGNTVVGNGISANDTNVTAVGFGSSAIGNDAAIFGALSSVGNSGIVFGTGSNATGNVIMVGSFSGSASLSGASNIIIGGGTGTSKPTTGVGNILIGYGLNTALTNTSSAVTIGGGGGSFDTAVGFLALKATSTNGNDSSALGYSALTAVTTGVHNNALGYQAGALITTGTGNIAIGYEAADSVLTVGNNNIVIGNALDVATSSTNNTINIGGIITASGAGTPNTSITGTAGTFQPHGYTVSTLPAGVTGLQAYVTDAVTCAFMGALTGGGTTTCPAFYNGAAWVGY